MNVVILTPEKELFKGEVSAIVVPGTRGQFEVLNGHAPIVSSLTEGAVRLTATNGEKTEYQIAKGFIEVIKNEVSVLVQLPKAE